MHSESADPILLQENRFSRFEKIEWWDQRRLKNARVLVVGAGALGNEVIKNLALLGIGNIVVVDMDHIEISNLSRSVLFRESDEGASKAECAAETARRIYPEINITPIVGNVLADVGLGFFRWADVVVGSLDNREARVFVNAACAWTGRPWIDGGIEIFNGIVRGFNPPKTACYECTMSQSDWDLINQRRSCSLIDRRAFAGGGVPTTPTTASVIGAMQVQEVVKWLHDMDGLIGRGLIFEGISYNSYTTRYDIKKDCPWHDSQETIIPAESISIESMVSDVWTIAERHLGDVTAIDFSREIVDSLHCPNCNKSYIVRRPLEHLNGDQALCTRCGVECIPSFFHSVAPGTETYGSSLRELGLPGWDILWARNDSASVGIEMSGDCMF